MQRTAFCRFRLEHTMNKNNRRREKKNRRQRSQAGVLRRLGFGHRQHRAQPRTDAAVA
ncbi:hypothetical protein HMPREF9120_02775 [Neisseria sp. oral taxon 020 str. F0370]|nr:hypothetical protein HMPREF9120_02775 [Neisseria sp. oral taxon 020 str. F0370]